MSAEHTNHEHASEHEGMSKKKIWQVFFYLLGITAIEFFIALYMIPKGLMGHGMGNFIYIVLTLVKAFYIVAYFMHLKFEKFALKTGITVSLIFIIYFIVLMLIEGSYQFVQMN
ncbi:cytochrome C oxidase subunit IV family protein [Daejeonella sp.]|jgi:cytochrome c oxidase subunit IV|uniref:cytochrome C oxidase subunit IV family protein n=1 Tax=Daejeonella sp. TaxID=2805397 RepID=UPI0025C29F87|nr:cytochrome C oxidase subunit IV family protein [Daejeonella sp.]